MCDDESVREGGGKGGKGVTLLVCWGCGGGEARIRKKERLSDVMICVLFVPR